MGGLVASSWLRWFVQPGQHAGRRRLRISSSPSTPVLASHRRDLRDVLHVEKYGKPTPSMMVNGMLAGWSRSTAALRLRVELLGVLIGAVSGVLVCWAAVFTRRR